MIHLHSLDGQSVNSYYCGFHFNHYVSDNLFLIFRARLARSHNYVLRVWWWMVHICDAGNALAGEVCTFS